MTLPSFDDHLTAFVFEMPPELPNDYCFDGGHVTHWTMVDWFNPIPPNDAIIPDGPANIRTKSDLERELRKWLAIKNYVKQGRHYVCIAPSFSFVFHFIGGVV